MSRKPYKVYPVQARRRQRSLVLWMSGVGLVAVVAVVVVVVLGVFGSMSGSTSAATTTILQAASSTEAPPRPRESTTTTLAPQSQHHRRRVRSRRTGGRASGGQLLWPYPDHLRGTHLSSGATCPARTTVRARCQATPAVMWRFGPMKGTSTNLGETTTWTGTGWTGQPCIFERDGKTWVVFGAYDYKIHFLDASYRREAAPRLRRQRHLQGFGGGGSRRLSAHLHGLSRQQVAHHRHRQGRADRTVQSELRPTFPAASGTTTGIPACSSATTTRSKAARTVTSTSSSSTAAYGSDGKVTVDPEIVLDFKGWTQKEISDIGSKDVGIENSPCLVGDRLYFTNSGGMVTCLDVSATLNELAPGEKPRLGATPIPCCSNTGPERTATPPSSPTNRATSTCQPAQRQRQTVERGHQARQRSGADNQARSAQGRHRSRIPSSGPWQ